MQYEKIVIPSTIHTLHISDSSEVKMMYPYIKTDRDIRIDEDTGTCYIGPNIAEVQYYDKPVEPEPGRRGMTSITITGNSTVVNGVEYARGNSNVEVHGSTIIIDGKIMPAQTKKAVKQRVISFAKERSVSRIIVQDNAMLHVSGSRSMSYEMSKIVASNNCKIKISGNATYRKLHIMTSENAEIQGETDCDDLICDARDNSSVSGLAIWETGHINVSGNASVTVTKVREDTTKITEHVEGNGKIKILLDE